MAPMITISDPLEARGGTARRNEVLLSLHSHHPLAEEISLEVSLREYATPADAEKVFGKLRVRSA
jgi:hypothetical protein